MLNILQNSRRLNLSKPKCETSEMVFVKNVYQSKCYGARKLISEFPQEELEQSGSNKLNKWVSSRRQTALQRQLNNVNAPSVSLW